MATDESTEEQEDQQGAGGEDEKSQEEMAAEAEEAKQQQYAESKRRVGIFQMASTVLLVAIALCCLYFGSSVGPTEHPLVENGLYVLGVANLVAALAMQVRKNWSRTLVLILMPLTIIGIVLTFTNTTTSSLLVCLLCVAEIYVMFRQPVLDEYDAPKE